jgi:NADH:ubiquinone oxidoreductase subunit F (NADH-binding)
MMEQIAASNAGPGQLERVKRWIDMVKGRGACKHPDGAVGLLSSALTVFADHVQMHVYNQRCYGATVTGFPQPPHSGQGWR